MPLIGIANCEINWLLLILRCWPKAIFKINFPCIWFMGTKKVCRVLDENDMP